MKKIFALVTLIMFLIPIYAQDFEDAQLFGSARNVKAFNHYDFGQITQTVVEHEFTIKNNDLIDLTIVSISLPQGVSVMIPKKVIGPGDEGKILVSVYREYIEELDDENKFDEKFTVTVQETLITGIIINKTYIYQISGKFE